MCFVVLNLLISMLSFLIFIPDRCTESYRLNAYLILSRKSVKYSQYIIIQYAGAWQKGQSRDGRLVLFLRDDGWMDNNWVL